MQTELLSGETRRAAEILNNGGLVAVPTETVYGLGANGLNKSAVEKIYEVKGRPAIKPLSLMVPNSSSLDDYCIDIPYQARFLADRFWPGPLTIVLKAAEIVPIIVRAGGSTVGLRCPDHPDTLEILRASGIPLAAPSANPSGAPSPKSAEDVLKYFDGVIDAVVDGGICGLGVESTIIDMSRTPFKILRIGALNAELIEKALLDSMTCVGITGGTGCGKTSVLNELRRNGFKVFDADVIYHRLLEESEDMIGEIRSFFPQAFVDDKFNRKVLGSIVFNDKEALQTLNNITHKYVFLEIKKCLIEYACNGGRYAAIDAIALFESGLNKLCSKTIAVTASYEVRVKRIMARDKISREYACMRIDSQYGNEYFEKICDISIENNSDENELIIKCRSLIGRLIQNG